MIRNRAIRVGVLASALVMMPATAFAHFCVNESANNSSPTVTFGVECAPDGSDVLDVKEGIQQRIDKFGLNEDDEPLFQFHGPIGLDFDCDGVADVITYEPGSGADFVIPAAIKADGENRPMCKGMTNFEQAFQNGCIELP